MSSPQSSDSLKLLNEILDDNRLSERIKNAKILLIGAGGIGCEVIKNLLLMGFVNVNMIDLDTIDVSNLNRQFLFNKSHVSQSKAEIAAKVSVANFAHDTNEVNVIPIHNSIQKQEFDVDFFKSHTIVINALDNRAARSHVNRMCLAADVPLIESGSEGYLGQCYLIKKNVTACYECESRGNDERTFASCTIRNTPSQPIHCIVWGKHLFSQLFGEDDPDHDVSPDMNDPELGTNGDAQQNVSESESSNSASVPRAPSTRQWAQSHNYDSKLLFEKLFKTDIEYLLLMDKLWEQRRKPIPLIFEDVNANIIDMNGSEGCSATNDTNGTITDVALKDQRLWSMKECLDVFFESVNQLKKQLDTEQFLVWDKDDESALNFVTSVSNLRSHCFGITKKSKFDVKSMAGNIIPAISSTNSIIGGVIALQTMSILKNLPEDSDVQKESKEIAQMYQSACKHVYLRKVGLNHKNLISGYELLEANPQCLVCCAGKRIPEIEIACSLQETTMAEFVDHIICNKLNFVCPDVQLDGRPVLLWNKEDAEEADDDEKAIMQKKVMSAFPDVADKTRLRIYDLLQNHTIIVTLKDVKINKNENEGLFYKMIITDEANAQMNEENKDEDEGEGEEQNNSEEIMITEVSTKTVEEQKFDDNKALHQINDQSLSKDDSIVYDEVHEVIDVSDDETFDESPIVLEDDNDNDNDIDVIEVREKRKIDEDLNEDNDSAVKRLKM